MSLPNCLPVKSRISGLPRPASGAAGSSWARGEKTRYALSDAEVQRYHQLVLKGQRDAADLLDAQVRHDPAAAAGLTAHAHLFVIAQPVGARTDLLERVIGGSGPKGWHDFLHSQVRSGRRAGRHQQLVAGPPRDQ